MKLEFNKKTVQRLLIALVILIVVGFVVYRMYAKSTYAYPGSDGTDHLGAGTALYTKLDDAIKVCQAIKQNGGSQANYDTCVSSNVSFYTSNSCPAVVDGVTSTNCATTMAAYNGTYGPSANCVLFSWTTAATQLTTDLDTINTAYNDIYNSLSIITGIPANPTTKDVVDAAKRADVRAATRKYLATVCGGNKFYRSNTMTSMQTTSTTTTLFLGYYTAASTSLTAITAGSLQTGLPTGTTALSYISGGTSTSLGTVTSAGTLTPALPASTPASTATSPLVLQFGSVGSYKYGLGYFTGQNLTVLSTPTPSLSSISGTITPGGGTITTGIVSGMTVAQGTSTAPVVFSISTSTTSGSDQYSFLDATDLFKGWTTVATGGSAPATITYGGGTVNYYFQDTNTSGGNANTGATRLKNWIAMAANISPSSGSEVEYTSISALGTGTNYSTGSSSTSQIPKWVVAQNIGPFTVLTKATGTPTIPMTWYDSATSTTKTFAYTIPTTDPYAS